MVWATRCDSMALFIVRSNSAAGTTSRLGGAAAARQEVGTT
jgi:hypothetical protein